MKKILFLIIFLIIGCWFIFIQNNNWLLNFFVRSGLLFQDTIKQNSAIKYSTNQNLLSSQEIENYYQKGSKRFTVYYLTEDSSIEEKFKAEIQPIVKKLIAYCEFQLEKYGGQFNASQSKDLEKITVRLYETFEKLNQGKNLIYRYISFNANPFTGSMSGFFDFKKTEIPERDIAKTATHETTHLMQYGYSPNTTAILPVWYKEGMAEYFQYFPHYLKEKYPPIAKRDYPISLEKLEETFSSKVYDDLIHAYIVAEDFFEFLAKKGDNKLIVLLNTKEYSDFENNFQREFGASSEEMYAQFLRYE